MKQFSIFLLSLAFITGCASHPGGGSFVPTASSGVRAPGSGALILRIKRPLARPDVISASTQAISVKITGPTAVTKVVALTVGSRGCKSSVMTLQCTLNVALTSCPSSAACYDGTVVTYDAYDKATGKIPVSAHKLSAEIGFSFWIGTGSTDVPMVLEGIPAGMAFIPSANSTLSGNMKDGFVEPKCSASAQHVNVLATDADGNYITGAGAPEISLSSTAPAQFGIAKTSSPNVYELLAPKAPGYPFGGHAVELKVKLVPGSSSGGKTLHGSVDVSYSSNICGKVTEFSIPNGGSTSGPFDLVTGPDGALWVTLSVSNKIVRVTNDGKVTNQETIPTSASEPTGIMVGPDHNLWFAEYAGNKIGRITTKGVMNEFGGLTASSNPEFLAIGADHNLWFTESGASQIGVMSKTGSLLNEYATLTANASPRAIVAGPDGALWFGEYDGTVGRISTLGVTTEYSSATGTFGVTVGPGNQLWFAEPGTNEVTALSTSGIANAQYKIPTATSGPILLVTGPDGALWFTEQLGDKVARLASDGTISEYSVPTGGSNPVGIAVGPDGAIWFTELIGGKIGRIY